MRKCKKCNEYKDILLFCKNKRCLLGHTWECKKCHNGRPKKPYKYVPKDPDLHKKKTKEYHRQNYLKKKDSILKRNRSYWETNKETHRKLTGRRYREQKHDPDFIHKRNVRANNKYNNDIMFRIKHVIRARLVSCVKKSSKKGSAVSDLGCTVQELKVFLEAKFYNNKETNEPMTWDNWGVVGWHIDHIKPLSKFNLSDREEFLKAVHYTNLQPLWYKDNIKKGNK